MISQRRAPRARPAGRPPAASRSRPRGHRREPRGLAQAGRGRIPRRAPERRRARASRVRSGRRSTRRRALPRAGDRRAQDARQGVDRPALDPGLGDHRLAPNGSAVAGESATRLSGAPANRSRNRSDQATAKPALAGSRGATSTPSPSRSGTQRPSEPSRGQLAPPSASRAARGWISAGPIGRLEAHRQVQQSRSRVGIAASADDRRPAVAGRIAMQRDPRAPARRSP